MKRSQAKYGTSMTNSAAPAESVNGPDSIPFATPEEMFIIKICASRTRTSWKKELQDIADAEFIAERLHRVNLVGDPLEPALDCLQEFLPKSIYEKRGGRRNLGLTGRAIAHWTIGLRFSRVAKNVA